MNLIHFTNEMGYSSYGLLKKDEYIIREISTFTKGDYQFTGREYLLNQIKILAPVYPSKIIAVGRNYKAHAEEMNADLPNEPLLFMKASTTIIAHLDNIILPDISKKVDYEAELAIVISKRAKNIPINEIKDYILGYTCLNDVTARDIQRNDGQWTRGKNFDTFCPLGPWIALDIDNPQNLIIQSRINGEIKQNSNTSKQIFPIYKLVSYITHNMTLLAGDVIATGTPAGVGALKNGDVVEIEIEQIGILKNSVISS